MQHPEAALGRVCLGLGQEPRLADPGLAGDKQYLAPPAASLLETALDYTELRPPTDERRGAEGCAERERHTRFSQHSPTITPRR
jgi:hypothetical protein